MINTSNCPHDYLNECYTTHALVALNSEYVNEIQHKDTDLMRDCEAIKFNEPVTREENILYRRGFFLSSSFYA